MSLTKLFFIYGVIIVMVHLNDISKNVLDSSLLLPIAIVEWMSDYISAAVSQGWFLKKKTEKPLKIHFIFLLLGK